jgi:hypothetical protein
MNLNLAKMERVVVYTILTLAACITALAVIGASAKKVMSKPALEIHAAKLDSLHKPIYDTLEKHGKKICTIEKKQRRYESLFYAQYSDKDIKRIRHRALELEQNDSLFE